MEVGAMEIGARKWGLYRGYGNRGQGNRAREMGWEIENLIAPFFTFFHSWGWLRNGELSVFLSTPVC